MLVGDAPFLKDYEVGNAFDVIPRGKLGMALGIDLQDDGATGSALGDTGDVRGRDAAGAAPRGPEVDEHRQRSGGDDFVEDPRVCVERPRKWGDRGLAFAAADLATEVGGTDAVLLIARRAGDDHGHLIMHPTPGVGVQGVVEIRHL